MIIIRNINSEIPIIELNKHKFSLLNICGHFYY